MDHTFIMAYICVYFACMEHTFIVVLLECFVELYFLFKKALYGLDVLFTVWTCCRWKLLNCERFPQLNKVTIWQAVNLQHACFSHKNVI